MGERSLQEEEGQRIDGEKEGSGEVTDRRIKKSKKNQNAQGPLYYQLNRTAHSYLPLDFTDIHILEEKYPN
jgi:hypothetical protein